MNNSNCALHFVYLHTLYLPVHTHHNDADIMTIL